jgi:hypothetical protein
MESSKRENGIGVWLITCGSIQHRVAASSKQRFRYRGRSLAGDISEHRDVHCRIGPCVSDGGLVEDHL